MSKQKDYAQHYVFNVKDKKYPDWLSKAAAKGLVKVNKNLHTGEIESLAVKGVTKIYTAVDGDTVSSIRNGLTVTEKCWEGVDESDEETEEESRRSESRKQGANNIDDCCTPERDKGKFTGRRNKNVPNV